jgi:hypothetical protein
MLVELDKRGCSNESTTSFGATEQINESISTILWDQAQKLALSFRIWYYIKSRLKIILQLLII